jgi:hypothetical protein
MSGQLCILVDLHPGEVILVSIRYEAVRDPRPTCMLCRREKSLDPAENRTLIPQLSSPLSYVIYGMTREGGITAQTRLDLHTDFCLK